MAVLGLLGLAIYALVIPVVLFKRLLRESRGRPSIGFPLEEDALPGRFRPQYFLTRTGVT